MNDATGGSKGLHIVVNMKEGGEILPAARVGSVGNQGSNQPAKEILFTLIFYTFPKREICCVFSSEIRLDMYPTERDMGQYGGPYTATLA